MGTFVRRSGWDRYAFNSRCGKHSSKLVNISLLKRYDISEPEFVSETVYRSGPGVCFNDASQNPPFHGCLGEVRAILMEG